MKSASLNRYPELMDGQRSLKQNVVICGSMSFFFEMVRIKGQLEKEHLSCVLPEAEDERKIALSASEYEQFKRKVVLDHMRRIRHKSTYCILVTNNDKYGIVDYIGLSTFTEIGMAAAFHKPVYLLGDYPQAIKTELLAFGVIALKGRFDRMVEDYRKTCRPNSQLSIIWD